MKGKKILFITVLVAFLMLLTTCVSAVNVSVTKTQKAVEIEEQDNNNKEQIDSEELNDIEKQINDLENLNIDWNDLLFRFGAFLYWAVYTGALILGLPQFVVITPAIGVLMGSIGFGLGIIEKSHDSIERFIAGFLLTPLTLLVPCIASFHLWTDGECMPEDGKSNLMELYTNLIGMFYGEDFDLKTLL